MRTETKGVHMDITPQMKEHIERKLLKLDFARDMIIDLLFTLTKEKNSFNTEANINFKWGTVAHISTSSFDIFEALDSLFDKLEAKITKEKDKIKQH